MNTVFAPAEQDRMMMWRGDALAKDAGLHRLPVEVIDELDSAVSCLARGPLPTIALDPKDFQLANTRRFMLDVRSALVHGLGFAVLDRLPISRWSIEQATQAYWLMSSCLARAVAQSFDGKLIYDVLDTGRPAGNGVRPDQTNVEQNFHTDNSYNEAPPSFVSLFCHRVARSGGVSGIVSFLSAHELMRARHPALLSRLYEPFVFDRQREHAAGDVMHLSHPLLALERGRLVARLSYRQVINGYVLAGLAMDDTTRAALDAFEAILNEPGLAWDFNLEAGQIQYLNNLTIGHRRSAFVDYDEPHRRRHLIRLWFRDWGRRSYPG